MSGHSLLVQTKQRLTQRPSRQKRLGLDYVKCSFCRKDKQKCTPSQRQWPSEKCQRCEQKHLPCSAPARARPLNTYESLPVQNHTIPTMKDIPVAEPIDHGMSDEARHPQSLQHLVDRDRDLDLLKSVQYVLATASKQLKRLAENMLRPFKDAPDWIIHAKALDKSFVDLDQFRNFVRSKLKAMQSTEHTYFDIDLDLPYGHRISGLASEETLKSVRRDIRNLSGAGHHGSAYLIGMNLMIRYSKQLVDADYQRLNEDQDELLNLLNGTSSLANELRQRAPKHMALTSLVLPILPTSFMGNDSFVTQRLVYDRLIKRVLPLIVKKDCLGRTSTHFLTDAGLHTMWGREVMDQHDILGRSSLHFACRNGDEATVVNLLYRGADISQLTITGLNPLHIAAAMGYTSICQLIHQNRPAAYNYLCLERDCTGRTPFLVAASAGHHETVTFFYDRARPTFSLDDVDYHGNSALILAVRAGHVSVVELLLKYAAPDRISMDNSNQEGRTPFWYAVHSSNCDMMHALVEVSDLNHRDNEGRTPLADAARRGDSSAIRFLYSYHCSHAYASRPIDFKGQDNNGKSVLCLAAENDRLNCVRLLLEPCYCPFDQQDIDEVLQVARISQKFALMHVVETAWERIQQDRKGPHTSIHPQPDLVSNRKDIV